MNFDKLPFRYSAMAILIFGVLPLTYGAAGEVNSSGPATTGSPAQVTEEILQLRQTFGSAWRDVGGKITPESSVAEETAIRTALLDEVRSNPLPEPIRPSGTCCRQTELRESAHQLDLVAHQLECQEMYDEADQLRAIAQRLREQAREKPPVLLHKAGEVWKPVRPPAAD